ncbi:techylectin-5B-like [Saccostrea echinata]|uniref:techylectin-5B-like n=1 Tax=Saccostrea echinata TaxID=191078 RepID=UPI002A841D3C|nr:techylectin-5B-like [Saccostrea echinata]XP_061189860.1 techylectin-5B-like [Saccostrea echinata]XP_061189861.1 techylectin-5B-like [Saccostrea echinata]XP_061189862.1 techylectin-5B-like [Saccostrea echinata]
MRGFLVILLFSLNICLSLKIGKNSKKMLKTKRCKYTFVVKEMAEGGHCPNQVQEYPQADKTMESTTVAAHPQNPYSIIQSTKNHILSGSKFKELEKRLKAVENMLEDQTVENTYLNQTIIKQESKLKNCDKMMSDYHKNITNMYRLMNHLQRVISTQRKGYQELERKVSGIVLDVVEVNNVLEKKVTTFDNTGSLKRKHIQVETISKVLNCGQTNRETTFKDCHDVLARGHTISGVYYITTTYSSCSIPVWCDMDTAPGGWLVIQNRFNGQVDFNRLWDEYRDGFGNIASEFWLGLDNIFLLSNQDFYELRFDLWDFEDNRVYALYKNFKLDGARDRYKIHATDFEGSAKNGMSVHHGMRFSTPDQDNDNWHTYHCGKEWRAGWWFNNCWHSILNGPYYNQSTVRTRGISWNDWKPEQLAKTQMKIRPSRLYKSVESTKQDQKASKSKPKDEAKAPVQRKDSLEKVISKVKQKS